MTDYDYAAMGEPTAAAATGSPMRKNKIKDDRSPWSPKRRNKKANRKNNKRNSGPKKLQQQHNKRQVVRTARRAGSFDEDDVDPGQLLGLGKPRPLPSPAPQLKPFVSVGVCTNHKKKTPNKIPLRKSRSEK